MKIYGAPQGGNPVRVAFFLAEKGVEVEYVNVDLYGGEHKNPEFIAKNPFARVPVLELDDGTCISESLAICRYFERLYPEPSLMGATALEEALIEMWQRHIELELYIPAQAVLRHGNPELKFLEPVQVTEWAEINRPRIDKALSIVDTQLAKNKFLAGDNYSIADITLLFTTQMLQYIAIPPAQAGENIARWYQVVSERPAVKSVMQPAQARN